MTKEEQQLLKTEDLSARLPYGVCVAKGNIIYPLTGINVALGYVELAVSERISIEEVKYYLRPMESMTDEEKKEFIHCSGYEVEESVNGRHYEYHLKDYVGTPEKPICNYNAIVWLIKHHFDYLGLIKLGIALEAPKGMYV